MYAYRFEAGGRQMNGPVKIAAAALTLALMAGRGAGGAAAPAAKIDTQQNIEAEACTEGEARDTALYVRNLNDFDWKGATLRVSKGGKTYLLGLEGQHISESRFDPLDRQPESVAPSEPFTDPSKFTTRGEGIRRDSKHGAPVIRLANFTYLDSVTVELDSPFASTWTGEVQECVG